MADTYPYRATLQYVADRCAELFTVENVEIGEPLDDPKEVLTDCDVTLRQADPQVVVLSRACNGFALEWQVNDAQKQLGLENGGGVIALLGLEFIYSDWYDDLKVLVYEEDERYHELAAHLHKFRVVDQFTDFDDAVVGIYLDQPRNPELYVYEGSEGELPQPLGVDVRGYLELLKLSLGYTYWQFLLVELNWYFAEPQTELFSPEDLRALEFISDMSKLNPDFTLEKFVARYDEVRLRRA